MVPVRIESKSKLDQRHSKRRLRVFSRLQHYIATTKQAKSMLQIQAVRAEERYNLNQRGKLKAKFPFETPVPFPVDRSVSEIPVFLDLPTQSQCPVIYYKKTKKINATPPSSSAVTTPGGASLIAPATTMG
jgi:hypothetical protein